MKQKQVKKSDEGGGNPTSFLRRILHRFKVLKHFQPTAHPHFHTGTKKTFQNKCSEKSKSKQMCGVPLIRTFVRATAKNTRFPTEQGASIVGRNGGLFEACGSFHRTARGWFLSWRLSPLPSDSIIAQTKSFVNTFFKKNKKTFLKKLLTNR